jgi:PAS domain S-box-containing protein
MGALEFGGLPGVGVATALPGLLNQAGVAMAALDGTGHLTMFSPGLESVIGRSAASIPAAALAKTLQLHTDDGRRLLAPDEVPLIRARAGETVRDALITTKRPDGTLRYLRCNAMPVPATAGDLRGAVSFVEDVTDAAAGSPTYADPVIGAARSCRAARRGGSRAVGPGCALDRGDAAGN